MNRTMSRARPHIVLATFIFLVWIAVAEQLTPGQAILGIAAALGGSWLLNALGLERALPRRPRVMIRLAGIVVYDIIRSNLAVARLALGGKREGRASFLNISLEIRDHTGLALLACIITATPGTIWVSYERATGRLLLHILDMVSEQEWLDTIRNRYERPLMEIFE